MNTKEVCRQLHVTPKMLRIYEERGLIVPVRKDNNYRDYSLEDLTRIKAVATLRELGFSMKEIKAVFEYSKPRNANIFNFYIRLKAIREKERELKEAENTIRDTINKLIQPNGEQDIIKLMFENDEEATRDGMKQRLIDSWDFDEMASDYINRFLKGDQAYSITMNGIKEMIREIKNTSVNRHVRFIDVGCGTCDLWEELDDEYDLTAMDTSLQMLMTSKKKVPWAKVVLEDILNDSVSSLGKFDAVISTFALHHIPLREQMTALRNIVELCEKDGTAIIADKSFLNHSERLAEEARLLKEERFEELKILETEFYVYSEETIKFLECLGCDVEFDYIAKQVGRYVIRKKA